MRKISNEHQPPKKKAKKVSPPSAAPAEFSNYSFDKTIRDPFKPRPKFAESNAGRSIPKRPSPKVLFCFEFLR